MGKYPAWNRRYEAVWKPLEGYTDWTGAEDAGRFRWFSDCRGLEDPQGYGSLGAEAILADLYGQ